MQSLTCLLAGWMLFTGLTAHAQTPPPLLQNLTYDQAAQRLLPEALDEIHTPLENLSPEVLPHEVKVPKDVRKMIVKVRDMVDLFAFALRKSSVVLDSKRDAFLVLREDLDKGYEIIGHFKDFYDTQGVETPDQAKYEKDEVKPVRKDLLKWRDDFLKSFPSYWKYLSHTLQDTVEIRDRKDLSDYFWGASDQTPVASAPAVSTFQLLIRDLLQEARKEWPVVRKIKNPGKSDKQIELYHSFRKRMRTVLKIVTYFPELIPALTAEDLKFLTDLSSQYGTISDEIVRLEKSDSKKDQEKILHKIEKLWDKLQDWEDEQDVLEKIRQLESLLGNHA